MKKRFIDKEISVFTNKCKCSHTYNYDLCIGFVMLLHIHHHVTIPAHFIHFLFDATCYSLS